MKTQAYPFILVVFALTLALLNLVSGPVPVAKAMAHEPGDLVSIAVATDQVGTNDVDEMSCVTIQRDTFGEVADCYIWQTAPSTSYNTLSLYTGVGCCGEKRSLIRFGLDFLPENAAVQSATFGIWGKWQGSGDTVTIYRITESWVEGGPTWDNFASNYDDTVEWGRFVVAGGPGFLTADITGLVSAWVDDAEPNYGLLLRNTSEAAALDKYLSSDFDEDVEKRPWLEVCYIVNDPPLAVDDSATTDEDTPVVISVLANDSDPDGSIDPTTVSIVAGPANGSVSVDPVNGDVTYSPDADYHGSDSFTYTVEDDDGATSNVATVTVAVAGVNDPPLAVDDSAATDEDTPVVINVLANDSDPDGSIDPSTVSIVAGPANGSVSVDPVNGDVTYSPDADYHGNDSFTYTVEDDEGATSNVATVTVTVAGVNDPPLAVDDLAATGEDTPVVISVLANDSDPDGDILTVSNYDITSAEGGRVYCTTAGACTYTPPAGFNGTDTFTYTASDGNGATDVATVTVTVGALAPVGYTIYLPLIVHPIPPTPGMLPDLVVERITATSDGVQVVVKNQGHGAVPPTPFLYYVFRVDLYVDPNPVPAAVNQTWNDGRCAQGAVWNVAKPGLLEPGDVITLTIGDAYYQPSLSNFPGSLPVGTPIYAQVDSANPDTTYGAVLENHEIAGGTYNNITGPVLSTLSVIAGGPVETKLHPPISFSLASLVP